jgi:hypothetical protein
MTPTLVAKPIHPSKQQLWLRYRRLTEPAHRNAMRARIDESRSLVIEADTEAESDAVLRWLTHWRRGTGSVELHPGFEDASSYRLMNTNTTNTNQSKEKA